LANEARAGSVTMLATMCTPMAWGFLAYHLYLLWAGTTTNETLKWADVRDDMSDGWVYGATRPEGLVPSSLGSEAEPYTPHWPKTTDQIIVRSETGIFDGSPNQDPDERAEAVKTNPLAKLEWVRMNRMKEVVNIYDIGLVANLKDVLSVR